MIKCPIYINLTKAKVNKNDIDMLKKENLFRWSQANINGKKTKALEDKIARMDDGCKDMWERGQADRKNIQALEERIRTIEIIEQNRHYGEFELRQEKARKRAKAIEIIRTILKTVLMAIVLILVFVGVVALAK